MGACLNLRPRARAEGTDGLSSDMVSNDENLASEDVSSRKPVGRKQEDNCGLRGIDWPLTLTDG